VLKSPGFEPQIVTRECWGAIGSGTDVDLYMSRLDLTPELQNLDIAGIGGFMAAFTYIIHRTIDEHRSALVSPCVHLCMVQRGGIVIRNSDHMTVSASGDRVEVRMPPVVRTLAQFEHLCRANGMSAAAAAG